MDAEDNRAVSALFRVFGSRPGPLIADRVELARQRAMHRGERAFFALLAPLAVLTAVGEGLIRWLGPVAGFLLALPAAFMALNLLPLLLAGRGPEWQWRLWLAAFALWGFWRREAGGWVGAMAWIWLGIAILNGSAVVLLVLRGTMAWTGSRGVRWRALLLVAPHAAAAGAGFVWGWPWAIAGGALMAAIYCACVLDPASQALGRVVRRTDTERVLLTIDDGPDPDDTPMLLDLLDRHRVKAVFFMIGEKVKAHPELAKEVIARGHEIGNHTLTHPQASFWCAGPWRTRREIAACQEAIEAATGVRPRWFRAPVGHRNWFTHAIAGELGLRVMGWSRRGYDAVEKRPEVALRRLLRDLSPGDIVLMHEGTPICGEVARGVLEAMERFRGAEARGTEELR